MSKGRRWMSQLKLSAYQPFLCLFVLFKSSTVQVMLAKLIRAIFMSHFINANASLSDTPLQTHTEIMCNQLSVHLKTIKLVHKINHRNEVPLCISHSNFLRDLVTFLGCCYRVPSTKNPKEFNCFPVYRNLLILWHTLPLSSDLFSLSSSVHVGFHFYKMQKVSTFSQAVSAYYL